MQRGQNEVTCERCLSGCLSGLEVTNLTDHHHIGVVTQNRAQPHGERHADLVVNRNLVHTLEVILNRILGGDHFFFRANNGVERGVKRGGLAAAGRAGDEKDPVRFFDQRLEMLECLLVQTQLGQAVEHVRLV